jgi:hypothetical protein
MYIRYRPSFKRIVVESASVVCPTRPAVDEVSRTPSSVQEADEAVGVGVVVVVVVVGAAGELLPPQAMAVTQTYIRMAPVFEDMLLRPRDYQRSK